MPAIIKGAIAARWLIMATMLDLGASYASGAKYPNEILDTPIVTCEQNRVSIKVKTSHSNPSHIYAEDFHDSQKCMVRNMNKISIAHGDCGMTTEHMDNPAGTMYRICVVVQIHPLFVTDADRAYCAQCVYMDANVVDDLEHNMQISDMPSNDLEPQFDEASNPRCGYSIRKGSVNGPEIHAAIVGETVFHVWQCDNENVGILVQNCHVEDLQGDKILIIDQHGCGVDQYLFRTPQYTSDLHTAYLESTVFKFVDKSMTRFRCQLRLCVKNRGHGCQNVTPPTGCPSVDEEGVMAYSMSTTAPTNSTSSTTTGSTQTSTSVPSGVFPSAPVASYSSSSDLGPPPPAMRFSNGVQLPVGGNIPHPPPANAGNHGNVMQGQAQGQTPTSTGSYGDAVAPSASPSSTTMRTIGPPSIRPYGLSSAHIVSAVSGRSPMGNSYHGPMSSSQLAAASPYSAHSHGISVMGSAHTSGYPYRNRRSIMLYGTGIRNSTSTRDKRRKRESFSPSDSFFSDHTTVMLRTSTQRAPIALPKKRPHLPEPMSVVGLIRVIDNPEDAGFLPDDKSPQYHLDSQFGGEGSSEAFPALLHKEKETAKLRPEQLTPINFTTANQSYGWGANVHQMRTNGEAHALNGVGQAQLPGDKGGAEKCLPKSVFDTMVIAVALLSTLQLVACIFFMLDRCVRGRGSSTKRI